MRDLFGQEVYVGSNVAVCRKNYRDFVEAKVIKLTPTGIRVEYKSHGGSYTETYFVSAPNFVKQPGNPDEFED